MKPSEMNKVDIATRGRQASKAKGILHIDVSKLNIYKQIVQVATLASFLAQYP